MTAVMLILSALGVIAIFGGAIACGIEAEREKRRLEPRP